MSKADESFAGTSGPGLPEAALDFSCKADNEVVNPEVVVDVKQDISEPKEGMDRQREIANDFGIDTTDSEYFSNIDEQWIRIPVTEVTEWINKDGPASMTRTARIKFPFEWGGQSIIKYINGFNSQNNLADQSDPYDECRIFFWDRDIEEWVIAHYGYVGGVGPANDTNGMGKFWVYDPADLMKGIQVSKSWGQPSISSVLDFALRGIDDTGDPVGLERRSVFSKEIPISWTGKEDLPERKEQDVRENDPQGFTIKIGPYKKEIDGLISDVFNFFAEEFVDPLLEGQKRFQLNRHNMVDMMEWFTNLIDARWWFEPSPDSPVLCIDASAYKSGANKGNYERRYFVDEHIQDSWQEQQQELRRQRAGDDFEGFGITTDDEEIASEASGIITPQDDIADELPPHNYNVFGTVDTLNNTALVDIKPFNTLYLYGESVPVSERYPEQNNAASPGMYSEKFPWVKVTYAPLLERAGGYEYTAQPIESDKVTLDQAEQQAKKEFRHHVAEQTEGSLQLRGEPHIMPYDYLVTVPTCNDTYTNANATPMTWEVNGVKHTRKAGEPYTTELGVSVSVDESLLNVESEYRNS